MNYLISILIIVAIVAIAIVAVLIIHKHDRKKKPASKYRSNSSSSNMFVIMMQRNLGNGIYDQHPLEVFNATKNADGSYSAVDTNGNKIVFSFSSSNPYVGDGQTKIPATLLADGSIAYNTGGYTSRIQNYRDWAIDAVPGNASNGPCTLQCNPQF